jgi:hypothetical protein
MLTFVAAGPLPPHDDYAAGYYRPNRPAEFVPLVTGCPNELVATAQAIKLADEQRARLAPPAEPHQFRRPSAEWYAGGE